MLKIRRPLGRLIFNMEILIPGKMVFLIETHLRWLSINLVCSENFGPSIAGVNSLWPKSESTLVQIMSCCLTPTSHYLNQCLLIICKVLWHSHGVNFTLWYIQPWYQFENQINSTVTFLRDQWVNMDKTILEQLALDTYQLLNLITPLGPKAQVCICLQLYINSLAPGRF